MFLFLCALRARCVPLCGRFLADLKKEAQDWGKELRAFDDNNLHKQPPFLRPTARYYHSSRMRTASATSMIPARISTSLSDVKTASTMPSPNPAQHCAQQLQSRNFFFIPLTFRLLTRIRRNGPEGRPMLLTQYTRGAFFGDSNAVPVKSRPNTGFFTGTACLFFKDHRRPAQVPPRAP